MLSGLLPLAALLAPAAAEERTRIEVPVFEGGEGLSFFFHAAREYEKVRPDVEVDLYGDPASPTRCGCASSKGPSPRSATPASTTGP